MTGFHTDNFMTCCRESMKQYLAHRTGSKSDPVYRMANSSKAFRNFIPLARQ